jgi:GNAT superfamily N-acetyltransferase
MISIFQAELQHLDALVPLFDAYRVFYQKPSDPDAARQFLSSLLERGDSIVYLAQAEDGAMAGFTQLYPLYSSTRMRRLWLLNDLYVQPAHRGKGISKKLIERCKTLARETDAAGIMLETTKDNDIGNQLYPKTGFELITDINFYFWSNG